MYLNARLADSANEGILRFQESIEKQGQELDVSKLREAARAATPIIDRVDRPPPPKGPPIPADKYLLVLDVLHTTPLLPNFCDIHLIWLLSVPSIDQCSTFTDDALVLSLELRVDVLARANLHRR